MYEEDEKEDFGDLEAQGFSQVEDIGAMTRGRTRRRTPDAIIADLRRQLQEATHLADQALASETALRQELRKKRDEHLPEIMPSKTYDGTTEVEDFLKNFNELAKLQKWSDRRKRVILRNKLDGEALSAVTSEDCNTFEDMVAVLKSNFATTDTSVYVMKLQGRVQGKSEGFDHLARDIMKLGRKAYPRADEDTLNEILKDAFLDAIHDESLRAMVRFKDPVGLHEAAKIAVKISAQSEKEKKLIRKTVVKTARTEEKEDSEYSKLCERLTKLEEKQVKPKKKDKGKKQSSKKTPPKCYGCGLLGHIKKYCPFDTSSVQMASELQMPPPSSFLRQLPAPASFKPQMPSSTGNYQENP